jgi:hypothetical protein
MMIRPAASKASARMGRLHQAQLVEGDGRFPEVDETDQVVAVLKEMIP